MAVEKEIIVAVEFGSSKIRGVAGCKNIDGSVQVLDIEQVDARHCIRKGVVYNIDKNIASRTILRHLVEMCTDLGVECIAEGVETKKQAEYLKEMGCNHIQGYLYSKPVNIESFEQVYMKREE